MRKRAPSRTKTRVTPRNRKPASNQFRAIFLVGFMGAGKSSVGRALALQLNWNFEDLDNRIEARERRTVAEIFRDSGESTFRLAERAALQEVLQESQGGAEKVIALGGGAFVQEEIASLLTSAGAPTVFLDASADELWQRCRKQADDLGIERPLLGDSKQFSQLYETRRRAYIKATMRIETGGREIDIVTKEIAKAVKALRRKKQ